MTDQADVLPALITMSAKNVNSGVMLKIREGAVSTRPFQVQNYVTNDIATCNQ